MSHTSGDGMHVEDEAKDALGIAPPVRTFTNLPTPAANVAAMMLSPSPRRRSSISAPSEYFFERSCLVHCEAAFQWLYIRMFQLLYRRFLTSRYHLLLDRLRNRICRKSLLTHTDVIYITALTVNEVFSRHRPFRSSHAP